MSGHEPNDAAAGFPLKAHVDELRSRCEAVARFQGGSTHYLEELAIFQTYAREKAEEDAQRQRMISQGKSVEAQQILAARQRAEAAEAEVARLRAEEDAALKNARQLEEYKAREAAAVAEAERIRTGK